VIAKWKLFLSICLVSTVVVLKEVYKLKNSSVWYAPAKMDTS